MNEFSLIFDALLQHGWTLATAESCSGGMLAAACTDLAGSSRVFGYGLVTYSNQAKIQLLQVRAETLQQFGAVSKETAQEMAQGLLRVSGANLALATTGIAGPDGGSVEKPVGLVYVAAATDQQLKVVKHNFAGDRAAVRKQTVAAAFQLAEEVLNDSFNQRSKG